MEEPKLLFSSPDDAQYPHFSETVIEKPTPELDAPDNQSTLDIIRVPKAWEKGFTGEGMVVAVIDSGMRPHNDLRLTDPTKAKISREIAMKWIEKLGYGTYINDKIPFAFSYGSDNSDYSQYDKSIDGGHGMAVAGCVAANGIPDNDNVDKKYIIGPAKEAQILNLKVYDTYPMEIPRNVARAVDDAIELGVDAINISMGYGIGTQDALDVQQAAINRAIEAGIPVCIAASNSGHAYRAHSMGGVLGFITDFRTVQNSSTTSNSAVLKDAFTVGSANALLDTDPAEVGLNTNSSWGPNAEFDLKPDIIAPGFLVPALAPSTSVSDKPDNNHAGESGTSFSSPLVAGCLTLMIQHLRTLQQFSNKRLAEVAQHLLMNTAYCIQQKNKLAGPPRQQGAGMVDLNAAINQTVLAETSDQKASLSLGNIGTKTTFQLIFQNFGTTDVTFDYQTGQGPLTPETNGGALTGPNAENGIETQLTTAHLTFDKTNFTVNAGQSVTLTGTLSIDVNTSLNQIIEGYIQFTATDGSNNLSMPYLGYFGDQTTEAVFDPKYNPTPNPSFLMTTDGVPLGFGGRADALTTVKDLNYPPLNQEKLTFSPNLDGRMDKVVPVAYVNQNLRNLRTKILTPKGQLLRQLDCESRIDKSYLDPGTTTLRDLALARSMWNRLNDLGWDGLIYNQATGNMQVAPDGQYQLVIEGDLVSQGQSSTQSLKFDISVDTTYPEITDVQIANQQLTLRYADAGSGFTTNANVWVAGSTNALPFNLKNNGIDLNGQLVISLPDDLDQQIGQAPYYVVLSDAAGNLTSVNITDNSITHVDPLPAIPDLIPSGHEPSSDYTKIAENSQYVTFNDLIDNSYNYLNASSKTYQNGILTIEGKITDQAQSLIILGNSTYETDANNQVQVDAQGNFNYQVALTAPTTKNLAYVIHATDGTVIHGLIELVLDTEAPTVSIDQLTGVIPGSDQIYRLTAPIGTFEFTGLCNDNSEGMKFLFNQNMLYRSPNGGALGDVSRPNPYGPYKFSQKVTLALGDNYFTALCVDQVGNQTRINMIVVAS